jgi:hypothetical protein
MHVDRQGRGRRPLGQPLELPAGLAEAEALAAEFAREVDLQEPRLLQLVPVLLEEPVLPVLGCGPLPAAVDELLRKD